MPEKSVTLRQKMIDDGVLIDKGYYFEFLDDYIFTSPSAAASMILGRNSNGLTEWKQKDGKTLKAYESNERTTKA